MCIRDSRRTDVPYLYMCCLFQFVASIVLVLCSISFAEEPAAPVQGPPSPHQPLPPERTSPSTSESSTVFKPVRDWWNDKLSLIHISEPTRLLSISYAVFCLK